MRSWKEDKPFPTIFDPRDAYKITYDRFVYYLRAPVQGYSRVKQIITGRNFKWRIFATFNYCDPETFAKHWTKAPINQVIILNFPTQTEQAWQVGFCIGLTVKQDICPIQGKIEEITGVKGAGASFQYMYQKEVTPSLWNKAEQKAKVGLNPRE